MQTPEGGCAGGARRTLLEGEAGDAALEWWWGRWIRLEQSCSAWAVCPPWDFWQGPGMCLVLGEGVPLASSGWGARGAAKCPAGALPGVTGATLTAPGLAGCQVMGGLAGAGGESSAPSLLLGPSFPVEGGKVLAGLFLLSWTG